jgi:sortase A
MLVGRIDIPKLDLSAVVFEGTSDETLARGVGHLMGSAGPGERGNLVLAGHRDTFFRKLRGIRKGDEVTVKGPDGEFQYQVESTAVVKPDQTEVLRPDGGSILTLITCYPFRFIGNAPDRFIVRARKIDTSAANKSRNPS